MKTNGIFSIFIFIGVILLPGCSLSKHIDERERTVSAYMNDVQNVARGKDGLNRGLKPFSVQHGLYIDAESKKIDKSREKLNGKTITLIENGYLADLGDKITRATGVTVRFSPDLSKRKDIVNMTMSLKHKGSLASLLDSIASYYSIFWEMDDESIIFYSMKTQTFSLVAFLSDVSMNARVSNKADSTNDESGKGSSVGGASGTSEQTVIVKGAYSGFDDCLKSIKEMLTDKGSITYSRGMGTITVTESPLILDRIDAYIKNVNAKLSRQVALNVGLYSYSLRDGLDIGYNLSAVFNDSNLVIATSGMSPGIVGGSMMATILEGSNNHWGGSEAVVQALKERGKVAMITTGSGLTLNNQPLPIQALKRTSYLESSSSTLSGDTSEVTLEPGQVVTGLSILVTPHILPDDRVLVEYSMSYSSLDALKEVSSGNSMIQTPEVSSRNILQRVAVRPGSTIVLAGLSQDFLSDRNQFGVFSLSKNNSDEKEFLIIIIDVADATLPGGHRG